MVYQIAERAIHSNRDLCLGEGRWPAVTACPAEDDSQFDERFGLDEEDSATLNRFIEAIVHQARLRSVCGQLFESAQGCGTAVAICMVRNGKLCVDTKPAKVCTPTFNTEDPSIVDSLEIRYPYEHHYFDDEDKKHKIEVRLYRRVIDATADTTYLPIVANEHGEEPDPSRWRPDLDPSKTMEHGLGFCPVVWYRHLPKCVQGEQIDGEAIHCRLLDEIDALNMALSQRQRSALLAGDPQIVETGVDEMEQPGAMGQGPRLLMGDDVERAWRDRRAGVASSAPTSVNTGRKRGPGTIWSYTNENAKVDLLALPGDALKAIEDAGNANLSRLKEMLHVVLIDPESTKIGSDVSGRALEWLHNPQINRCNQYREDFGDNCILPLVNMLLRIVLAKGRANPAALRIGAVKSSAAKRKEAEAATDEAPQSGPRMPGLAKILPILERFEQPGTRDDGTSAPQWFAPDLELVWGPYFAATEVDQKTAQDMAQSALEAKMITQRTAVEKIAPFYGIKNVDQYVEALDGEAREAMGRMHDAQAALAGAGQMDAEDDVDEEQDTEEPIVKPKRVPPQRKPPAAKAKPAFKKRVKRAA